MRTAIKATCSNPDCKKSFMKSVGGNKSRTGLGVRGKNAKTCSPKCSKHS